MEMRKVVLDEKRYPAYDTSLGDSMGTTGQKQSGA